MLTPSQRSQELQNYFNFWEAPAVGGIELPHEVYLELLERWLRESRDSRFELVTTMSKAASFHKEEFFWQAVRAIQNPSLPLMDYLWACTMPHAKFRPLIAAMTGFNEWQGRYYFYEALMQFVPLHLVATYLSIRAGCARWRRPHNTFYAPRREDYAGLCDDMWDHSLVVKPGGSPIELSLIEFCDRMFLGAGGLWSDQKLNGLAKISQRGIVFKFAFRKSGAILKEGDLPGLDGVALNYYVNLTRGVMLPFTYRTILGDLNYANEGNLSE